MCWPRPGCPQNTQTLEPSVAEITKRHGQGAAQSSPDRAHRTLAAQSSPEQSRAAQSSPEQPWQDTSGLEQPRAAQSNPGRAHRTPTDKHAGWVQSPLPLAHCAPQPDLAPLPGPPDPSGHISPRSRCLPLLVQGRVSRPPWTFCRMQTLLADSAI